MKIEISTDHNTINKLINSVDKLAEDVDPDDAPKIHCGFALLEAIGDIVDYFFGDYFN